MRINIYIDYEALSFLKKTVKHVLACLSPAAIYHPLEDA